MPQHIFDSSTELPALQPRTHCILMPRDPNCIYAYWDYTQEDIDNTRNQLKFEGADSQLVLRIYDITFIEFSGSNTNRSWDLDVGFSTKNWYIHVWQDNAVYCAELGLRPSTNSGLAPSEVEGLRCGVNRFIPLARSNTIRTPPKSTSPRNDLIWQDIKARKESQPYIREDIKDLSKRSHSFKKFGQAKQSLREGIYYLTPQDIRAYYREIFSRVSKKSKSNIRSLEDILKGKLRGKSWQKVEPLMTNADFIRRHLGASMELIEKWGASENLLNAQEKNFFFEIWTELLVYGRTEPDAAVWLNQKGIKLNPDGTFSLRYVLTNGEIPLKFIAQSSDGAQQRHISTRVKREKTVSFPKMLKEPHG